MHNVTQFKPQGAPSHNNAFPLRWRIRRDRLNRILTLSLPIIGGMVSQTLLNLVDTAMVGTLGDADVAAVGLGGFTHFLSVSLVIGMAAGVQIMAARRKGEGRIDEMAIPLNGGLLLVVLIAVPLSVLLYCAAPMLFPLLVDDPQVASLGTEYIQMRLIGMTFIGMNFAFRGYWNAVDLSMLYMRTLILMHISNVAISYVLIFGAFDIPAMGSKGAGIGTTVSVMIGTFYYIWLAYRHASKAGFLRRFADAQTLRSLQRLSVPSALQQLFFSGGFVALFWIIGQVGTSSLAAANVLINVTLLAILPGLGLGLAANTLVGQALGKNDPKDASRWAWEVVRVGVVLLALIGLPMLCFPETILGVFLHAPSTLGVAKAPLRIVGASISMEAVALVLLQALMGAGATRTVFIISTGLQWVVFLPVAYLIGPIYGHGLLGIWIAQLSYRLVLACIFVIVWHRGRWATMKV